MSALPVSPLGKPDRSCMNGIQTKLRPYMSFIPAPETGTGSDSAGDRKPLGRRRLVLESRGVCRCPAVEAISAPATGATHRPARAFGRSVDVIVDLVTVTQRCVEIQVHICSLVHCTACSTTGLESPHPRAMPLPGHFSTQPIESLSRSNGGSPKCGPRLREPLERSRPACRSARSGSFTPQISFRSRRSSVVKTMCCYRRGKPTKANH